MKRIFFITVFVSIVSFVFAQERIAIFPFEDLDNVLSSDEMNLFYTQFSTELANKSGSRYSVVPRQDLEKFFVIEFKCFSNLAREKMVEMNRMLYGSQILTGSIYKLDNSILIFVSLYTYPELMQLPGGASMNVANKYELFDKIPELVQRMLNAMAGNQ